MDCGSAMQMMPKRPISCIISTHCGNNIVIEQCEMNPSSLNVNLLRDWWNVAQLHRQNSQWCRMSVNAITSHFTDHLTVCANQADNKDTMKDLVIDCLWGKPPASGNISIPRTMSSKYRCFLCHGVMVWWPLCCIETKTKRRIRWKNMTYT